MSPQRHKRRSEERGLLELKITETCAVDVRRGHIHAAQGMKLSYYRDHSGGRPESVQFDSASVSSKIMGDRQVHSLSCCLTKSSQRSKRSLISTLVADPLYIMVAASTSQQPYLASATSLIKALKSARDPPQPDWPSKIEIATQAWQRKDQIGQGLGGRIGDVIREWLLECWLKSKSAKG